MPRRPRLALFCLAALSCLAVACSDSAPKKEGGAIPSHNSSAPDAGDTASTDAGTSDTGESDAGEVDPPPDEREEEGPEFLELSLSSEGLTQGEALTVTALVTDPQGFADIGGGRIVDADGNAVASFQGTGGTYTATLQWQQIHAAIPITFEETQPRNLVAEFFDAANHRSTRAFTITLHCDGEPACDGECAKSFCPELCADGSCSAAQCVDDFELLNDAEHCGTCGNACAGDEICEDGSCVCEGLRCGDTCVDPERNTANCGACGNACPASQTCASASCVNLDEVAPFTSCDEYGGCLSPENCRGLGCEYDCQSDADCLGDWLCASEFGLCYVPCTQISQCPDDQSCQSVGGYMGCFSGAG